MDKGLDNVLLKFSSLNVEKDGEIPIDKIAAIEKNLLPLSVDQLQMDLPQLRTNLTQLNLILINKVFTKTSLISINYLCVYIIIFTTKI
jgi:hypothetical protein